MEHRCNRRVPLDIKALIYKHGEPVATGRIRNASDHGLYLETDYRKVRKMQKLELEVLLGRPVKGIDRCHLHALVVHKSKSGYGLEIGKPEDTHGQALRAYIEHQQVDQHRQTRDLVEQAAARAANLGKGN